MKRFKTKHSHANCWFKCFNKLLCHKTMQAIKVFQKLALNALWAIRFLRCLTNRSETWTMYWAGRFTRHMNTIELWRDTHVRGRRSLVAPGSHCPIRPSAFVSRKSSTALTLIIKIHFDAHVSLLSFIAFMVDRSILMMVMRTCFLCTRGHDVREFLKYVNYGVSIYLHKMNTHNNLFVPNTYKKLTVNRKSYALPGNIRCKNCCSIIIMCIIPLICSRHAFVSVASNPHDRYT